MTKKTRGSFYGLVLAEIRDLKNENDELREILDFYQAVLDIEAEINLATEVDTKNIDIAAGRSRNEEGLAFLKAEDVWIKEDLFLDVFADIGRVIQERAGSADGFVPDKIDLRGKWQILLKQVMRGGSSPKEIAKLMETNRAVAYFVLVQSFSPFLDAYAEKVRRDISETKWLKGYCPICGGEPLMARLDRESGGRWLFCSLCHYEWLFRRLECPYCGNTDQESLRYFYSEDEKGYRVDVCDKCRRYIKTADARKMVLVRNLFVEYLITLPLDIVAEKEGFVSRGEISLFEKEQA